MRNIAVTISLFLISGCAENVPSPGNRDGQVHVRPDTSFLAWDAVTQAWYSPEEFWQRFSERRRGHIWPSSTEFPRYADPYRPSQL